MSQEAEDRFMPAVSYEKQQSPRSKENDSLSLSSSSSGVVEEFSTPKSCSTSWDLVEEEEDDNDDDALSQISSTCSDLFRAGGSFHSRTPTSLKNAITTFCSTYQELEHYLTSESNNHHESLSSSGDAYHDYCHDDDDDDDDMAQELQRLHESEEAIRQEVEDFEQEQQHLHHQSPVRRPRHSDLPDLCVSPGSVATLSPTDGAPKTFFSPKDDNLENEIVVVVDPVIKKSNASAMSSHGVVQELASLLFDRHEYTMKPFLQSGGGRVVRTYEGGFSVAVAVTFAVSSLFGWEIGNSHWWLLLLVATLLGAHLPHKTEETHVAVAILGIAAMGHRISLCL